jgi:hypothetical protein
MPKRMHAIDHLREAMAAGELVELQRSVLAARSEEGAVVGIGRKWVLIHRLEDGCRLTGYQAVRVRDIARTRPLVRSFSRRALAASGQRPRIPEGIELDRTRDVLRSATKHFRIVSVHLEYTDPDVCYIGAARVGRKHLHLHEITPNARWRRKPASFHLANISRIDFDGQYERALLAVADAEAQG